MKDNVNKIKKDITEFYEYLHNLWFHYKGNHDDKNALLIEGLIYKYWELFKPDQCK